MNYHPDGVPMLDWHTGADWMPDPDDVAAAIAATHDSVPVANRFPLAVSGLVAAKAAARAKLTFKGGPGMDNSKHVGRAIGDALRLWSATWRKMVVSDALANGDPHPVWDNDHDLYGRPRATRDDARRAA